MNNWFECKIKYEKTTDDGKIASVNENYLVDALSFTEAESLVDALSFTEAESRIIEEMKPFISGEFSVSGIKRARISELFPSDDEEADKWYRCKVFYLTIDEEKGIEKRTGVTMLVQAADLKGALEGLVKGMETYMGDYEIASIAETTLMDVYPYEAEK